MKGILHKQVRSEEENVAGSTVVISAIEHNVGGAIGIKNAMWKNLEAQKHNLVQE